MLPSCGPEGLGQIPLLPSASLAILALWLVAISLTHLCFPHFGMTWAHSLPLFFSVVSVPMDAP